MKIRLGYVAIAKKLGKKITSSSTVTFTNYNKISTSEKKLEKLKAVSASNLKNLGKILNYNIENKYSLLQNYLCFNPFSNSS